MRGGGLIIEIVTIPGEIHLMLRSDNRRPKTPPPRDWTQHRQGSGGLLTEIQRCLVLKIIVVSSKEAVKPCLNLYGFYGNSFKVTYAWCPFPWQVQLEPSKWMKSFTYHFSWQPQPLQQLRHLSRQLCLPQPPLSSCLLESSYHFFLFSPPNWTTVGLTTNC